MNRFGRAQLNNVVSFVTADMPFTKNNGLVTVSGINYDSMENENTNGVGKSLLFSALPNAIYEASPLDGKIKKTKKDMLDNKNSNVKIGFHSHTGDKIQLVQTPTKYQLFVNGKDQKIGKQSIVLDKMKKFFPISEDEFYSFCYVQSQRPLKFQVDTEAERLKFITEVFELDIYDQIRQALTKRKGKVAEKETEYKVYAGQLDGVLQSLKDLGWSSDKNKVLNKAKKTEVKYQEDLKVLYTKQAKLTQALVDIKEASYLQDILKKLRKEISLTESEIDKQLSLHQKWSSYREKKNDHETLAESVISNLKRTQKSLGDRARIPLEELRERYQGTEASLQKLIKVINKMQDDQEVIDDLNEDLSNLKKQLKNYDLKPTKDSSSWVKDVDEPFLRAAIDLAEGFHDHEDVKNCPTCGHDVDVAFIRKLAKKAQTKLDKHKKILKAIKINDKYLEVSRRLKGLDAIGQIDPLLKDAKKLKKQLDGLKDYGTLLKDMYHYEELHSKLNPPKKPKTKPSKNYTVSDLKSMLRSIQRHEVTKAKLEALMGTGIDLSDSEGLLKRIAKFKSKVKDLEEKYFKIKRKVSNLNVKKKSFNLLTEQEMKLNTSLEKIAPIVKEKEMLSYLWKKFGATELKLQAAGKMLKLLEDSLNKYAPLVFSERFTFQIKPSAKGIAARVTRQNGKESDIRKMSGAETNCFRLLFAVALLPLVPAHKRVNFIILDEPDAACSPPVRSRLIQDFLPKLRTIVPHVFWITPKEVHSFAESENWTVQKKKGVSSLKIK